MSAMPKSIVGIVAELSAPQRKAADHIENVPLTELAAVLGCSKAAASMLRTGHYSRPGSELHARYAALAALLQKTVQSSAKTSLAELCFTCPRQDCTGCRAAELE